MPLMRTTTEASGSSLLLNLLSKSNGSQGREVVGCALNQHQVAFE